MPWPAKASRNKYGAEAIEIDGRRFASKAEGRRYGELRILEKGKRISSLQCQVPFALEVNGHLVGKYVADFVYIEDGNRIVEDVKSPATRTDAYLLKKKLMRACHGIDIVEVTRS